MVFKGQKRHTEVLFPENRLKLVENVYTSHPISKEITKQLVAYIISTVHEYSKNNPSVRFNLLEIGRKQVVLQLKFLRHSGKTICKSIIFLQILSEGFFQKARMNPRLNY